MPLHGETISANKEWQKDSQSDRGMWYKQCDNQLLQKFLSNQRNRESPYKTPQKQQTNKNPIGVKGKSRYTRSLYGQL